MTRPAPIDLTVAQTVDCSGLLCPLPVYKAGIVLGALAPGEVMQLVTTDPGALADIPALARQRGDTLLAVEQDETTQRFWIEKGPTR